MQKGRSSTGSGMPQQGMPMPPNMPNSPMNPNPAPMNAPGDPMMMQPPSLSRGYSGGNLTPFPYNGSPMPAAPGATSQQQRMLQMQIQQQQQQIMQLQQHQQQAAQLAASKDRSSTNQYQQIMPQPQQSPQQNASPTAQKSPIELAPSNDLMRFQTMQQQQQGAQQINQNSGSGNAQEPTSGSIASIPQPPLYQRSSSAASSLPATVKFTAAPQQPHPPEMFKLLLSHCSAMDKIIYVAKTMLGGSSVNGFLKGTASAQRTKRQRARQVAASQKKDNPEAAAAMQERKRGLTEQQQEEELKKEAMNVRTAKKIKTELLGGKAFCTKMHGIVSSILAELDPHGPQPAPLGWKPITPSTAPKVPVPAPKPLVATTASGGAASNPSQGDPAGSTLRKLRKRKAAAQNPSGIDIRPLEYDENGRRVTKKEHARRIFEVLRFRSLKKGDYVAARVSSRDLWISAIVVSDYAALEMSDSAFLLLSEAKRNSLFRQKVSIKDADERDGGNVTQVSRELVLPLPRNYAESTDWCSRIKKGARVYAMFPKTTSLYSATVVDSTTYCRGEDDVIVVEFDGDEADLLTGSLPQRHIPARFVTAIPKEFPASQTTKKKRGSSSGSGRKNTKNTTKHKRGSSDAALNDMLNEMSPGNFPADGDLGNFEQLEMGAFDVGNQATMSSSNPGLNRK